MKKWHWIVAGVLAAALILALAAWVVLWLDGSNKLLNRLPKGEWSEFQGGAGQYDTPGADVFSTERVHNHPEAYDIPAGIRPVTQENLRKALSGVRIEPDKDPHMPEGNFYMYGFHFYSKAGEYYGLTICENGQIIVHTKRDGKNWNTFWLSSSEVYQKLREIYGDVRDYETWKKPEN